MPEFYAESPEELAHLLKFNPAADAQAALHLPRWINLFDEHSRGLVLDFAGCFGDRLFGLIIHDHHEISHRFENYKAILEQMNSVLERMNGPRLFIEYASGLDTSFFCRIFEEIRELRHISCCLDIGHIGLRQASVVYSYKHPGEDVCSLSPQDAGLADVMGDVQAAVEAALAEVLRVIRRTGCLGKPVHFHLHDGHPLSTFSPYGVSDHLSFFTKIVLPFEYLGRSEVGTMFGPAGLFRIVGEARRAPGPERVSFSLEIHPVEGRLPLGDAAGLFAHWKDKGNAERMNFWLSVLRENQRLLQEAMGQ